MKQYGFNNNDVFTKEKIWDSLTRNAAYIIEESQRIYNKEPKNKEPKNYTDYDY